MKLQETNRHNSHSSQQKLKPDEKAVREAQDNLNQWYRHVHPPGYKEPSYETINKWLRIVGEEPLAKPKRLTDDEAASMWDFEIKHGPPPPRPKLPKL